MAKAEADAGRRLIAQNRRARHDYHIEEVIEAGLVLTGTEVKSLRAGRASINEAYAGESEGAIYLFNANILPYGPAQRFNHEPKRPRKLLLHLRQQNQLLGAVQRKGYTLVPLKLYFNRRGIAKLEIGLARGKDRADKRQATRERDWQRDKARLLRDKG